MQKLLNGRKRLEFATFERNLKRSKTSPQNLELVPKRDLNWLHYSVIGRNMREEGVVK